MEFSEIQHPNVTLKGWKISADPYSNSPLVSLDKSIPFSRIGKVEEISLSIQEGNCIKKKNSKYFF